MYTDGCSFDLARTAEEIEQSERRTLGPMVYRMHEATDSLYKDCTGPSLYSKAQSERVRVWGLLIDSQLHISILEKGTVMNRWECAWLLEHRNPLSVMVVIKKRQASANTNTQAQPLGLGLEMEQRTGACMSKAFGT